MSTKSLLLASVAYIFAGLVAGSLLANGNAGTSNADSDRQTIRAAMPVPNTEAKRDRLAASFKVAAAVATVDFPSLAQNEPRATGALPQTTMALALAAEPAANDQIGPPVPFVSQPPVAPKPRSQPKRQAGYALLSDEQIASLRERMKLTPSQQLHWPAIEVALRKLAARLHKANPNGTEPVAASIDPNSPEVQDLKTAAFPLLFTLSEDQKREVRSLARVIGLEAVASAI